MEQIYGLAVLALSLGLHQWPTLSDAAGLNISPQRLHYRELEARDSSSCECGTSASGESSRMAGGMEVQASQFPFMVLLESKLQGQTKQCGAFFISKKYLLTAAHCVATHGQSGIQSLSDVSATMLSRSQDADKGRLSLDNIYVHPQYTEDPISNDIALLSLKKSLNGTSRGADQVCLPGQNDYYVGERAVMAGFDSVQSGTDATLAVGPTTLMNPSVCTYGGSASATVPVVICASNMESTLCLGDGGMPLLSMQNVGWTAIGIASYGSATCEPGPSPTVYTRIYTYLPFIASVTTDDPPCLV